MSKKMFSAALVLTLLISLLAACSGNGSGNNPPAAGSDGSTAPADSGGGQAATADYGDTGGLALPLVDKPTTIKMLVVSDSTKLNEKWAVQELERRTGVKVNLEFYSTATFKEKLNFILASGDLPDIIHGPSLAELNDLGGKGAFAAINDYLDQLPNFKALYVDNPDNNWVMKSYSDEKGNLYTWPTYGINREVNHGFLYRKDIFDKHNIPLWTNQDKFYQALKKLKELYPNSVHMADLRHQP